MTRPKQGESPSCPFCGATAQCAADRRGHIRWQCGSFQCGVAPHQDVNCEHEVDVCQLEWQIASHKTTIGDLQEQLAKQQTEVTGLRKMLKPCPRCGTYCEQESDKAIVAQLPTCWRLVDGKLVQDEPVVPGMKLYAPNQLGNPDISETVASEVGDYSIWANSPGAAEALGRKQ
jgi:hypothetical protein